LGCGDNAALFFLPSTTEHVLPWGSTNICALLITNINTNIYVLYISPQKTWEGKAQSHSTSEGSSSTPFLLLGWNDSGKSWVLSVLFIPAHLGEM